MRRRSLCCGIFSVALMGAAFFGAASAQSDPGEHDGHHPGQSAPTTTLPVPSGPVGGASRSPPSLPATGPGGQGAAGCSGMMGCMGTGARPFYASLLDMPALTPEARRFIEAEANTRIGWGSQAISSGQARLQDALAGNDPTAIQQAAENIREGLLQLQSGSAALRAIAAGTAPRQLALAWFKDQVGVQSAVPIPAESGLLGLSWYHLTTMAFLVAFLVGALLVQYARMRKIGSLVQRLTPLSPEPGPNQPPNNNTASTSSAAASPAATNPAPAIATRPWTGGLRVAAIFRETADVKTFRLSRHESGSVPFTFLPGQFVTFSAKIADKQIRRSYTIASSPTQRDFIEITVKREEQGLESRYLHDHVAVGDTIEVSGPYGNFTFSGTESDSIVLISGGVGITPMMCVMRYLTDRSYPGDIFFLYGARSARDFIFREELEYLEKRHANMHLVATMEEIEGSSWRGAVGRISKAFIAQAVPDIAWRRVHVCGPPAMMEAVKTQLIELGVAPEKIKTEAFGPAQGRTPAPATQAHTDASLGSAEAVPEPASPTPAIVALPPAGTTVEFTTSGKTAPLGPDQSVLEAAEAIGVEIDYSCRVGTCGICVVPLTAGKVTMEVEEGLPPAEKARGMILACQAKSVGSLVVEA